MAEGLRNEYEIVFIAKPTLGDDGVAALNDRFAAVITGQGGEVTTTELWGKRTLAYPIEKFFEGFYILSRVALPPKGTIEVDRMLRLNEDVLRHLIVRTDE
ncbi:MAG: 30S ribosomal protein S6 [Caldilineaceae bacterium]